MKKIYLALSLFATGLCMAQNPIPNPNFDTYWPSNPGQPGGWTDSRDIAQVSPGYGGNGWAAQGYKTASTYPAFITSSGGGATAIPISSSYAYFNLQYKFTSVAADVLYITATIRDASQAQIGYGATQTNTSTSGGFVPLSIPIFNSVGTPHDVIISVIMNSSGGLNPNVGSNFIIDNLSLSNSPLAVEEVEKESSTLRVYPNPASNFIQIRNTLSGGKTAMVQITNILGQTVKQLDITAANSRIDISDLQPGNYIVTLKQDDRVLTKRLEIE